MPVLPPPIREEDFLKLETRNTEVLERQFEIFSTEIATYLNASPILSDIQQIRRRRNPGVTETRAFRDELRFEPEHWYTFNIGGRSEAQFNLGMFPSYLRVGLGFEMTKKQMGDPEAAERAYMRFRKLVGNDPEVFETFVQNHSIQIEWIPESREKQQYIQPHEVTSWLSRKYRGGHKWVFVGRLLDRREDAEILGDPERLSMTIEAVFKDLKPLWEECNLHLKEHQ